MSSFKRSAWTAAWLCLALFTAGCGTDDSLEATVTNYINAVQGRDVPALWVLRSGAGSGKGETPTEAFEREAQDYFNAYELGKRAGEIRFDPWGVAAIRILALGKGAYYRIVSRESPQPGARLLKIQVPLPYEQVDYKSFPDGTVLYFLAPPLGRVHKHTMGASSFPFEQELLAEITLQWALVEDASEPPLSPSGWTVLTVSPLEGSAVFRMMKIGAAAR